MRQGVGDRAAASPLGHSAAPALAALAGIGLLSIMDALVKLVASDLSTWQIVLLRYVFGTLFALPLLLAARRRRPSPDMLRAHLLRAVAIVLTAASFFYALAKLPLAVTLALSFTSPIMIAFLARLSLGERPGGGVLAAIGVGFAGVLLVLVGELDRSAGASLPGVVAAMASAAFYAVTMVSLKARAARDPLALIVLLQNAFAALLVLPLGAWAWATPAAPTLAWLALIGLLGVGGHVALTWAYRLASASRLGALDYTAFLWATGLGFLVFGEVPTPPTLAGAALIIGGALLAVRAAR